MRAAAVPHLLAEFGASVLAESGRGDSADAEVRDRSAARADSAAPRLGGGGGAAACAGAGEESDGGWLRFELD